MNMEMYSRRRELVFAIIHLWQMIINSDSVVYNHG